MQVRDEYAASQVRGFGCGFWVIWLTAVALGAFLGQAAGQLIVRTLLPGGERNALVLVPVMVLAGGVMGAMIGAAQGLVMLRYIEMRGYGEWVLASAVGGALRWALVGSIGQFLILNLDMGIGACNLWVTLVTYGVLSGVVFGLPQAVVLTRRLGETNEPDRWAWLLANAGGTLLSIPVIMLTGLTTATELAMGGIVTDEYTWRAIVAVVITWIVIGAVTALPLIERLRHSPRVATSTATATMQQKQPHY